MVSFGFSHPIKVEELKPKKVDSPVKKESEIKESSQKSEQVKNENLQSPADAYNETETAILPAV